MPRGPALPLGPRGRLHLCREMLGLSPQPQQRWECLRAECAVRYVQVPALHWELLRHYPVHAGNIERMTWEAKPSESFWSEDQVSGLPGHCTS